MSRHQSLKRSLVLFNDVIALTIMFAVLVLVARLIGSAQPPPAAFQALHLTDCALPCWIGIVPGKTTLDEAARRVSAAYPMSDTGTFSTISNSTIYAGYISQFSVGRAVIQVDTHRVVRQITLITSDVDDLRLGDVVNLYGTPTCTYLFAPSVIYGSGSTFAYVGGTSWIGERWLSPLNNIDIRGYGSAVNPCLLFRN